MRLSATVATAATAAVLLAAVASAGQLFRETFHEEETYVIDDFCGVSGLRVEVDAVRDGTAQAVPHGADRLPYFMFHVEQREVLTNLANGNFVTTFTRFIDKDLRVTDNHDGTLTILVLATGNAAVYGEDGKALARNPGQVRFEVLLDHGGTPADPSDDEFLRFLGEVKGSTGRTDDFCAAVVPALTD